MPVHTSPAGLEASAQLELDRYGIEVVSVKSYLWGGYRYSTARDAVAAASRENAKTEMALLAKSERRMAGER